ncbi:MAG: hypothetical protein IJK59_09360 [Firmicutes bacterium]|nr:hypothetical protein [Bacillota bacterium]
MGRGLKAQMKYADRTGARWCLVIGDNELEKGVCVVRDMQGSEQTEVPFDSIMDNLK